jgi:hypothetical protein
MVEKDNKRLLASSETHQQDWGAVVGAGVVALVVLVMVINLSVCRVSTISAELPPEITIPPLWLQIGRCVGLLVSLGGGGWLMWKLLRRRQVPEKPRLQASLQQAIDYTQRIEELLRGDSNEHQQQLLAQIHTWRQTIEVMVRTLADLNRNDHLVQRDLHRLPDVIADLEKQLTGETNSLLRSDLEQMLHQRENQQQALEQLQTTRRRAEIQVERAAAVLGTVYSQLLTYRSTFHVADYQRLADNVAEEVQRLQDYLEALEDWAPQ